MKRIYKYQLEVTDEQCVALPKGADLLCVQSQKGKPCLWAIIDDKVVEKEHIQIITHRTGHLTFGNIGRHLGTYQLRGGDLVFHCFTGIQR